MDQHGTNDHGRPEMFLRWPAVHKRTGLSRSTIWRIERRGEFPKRRRLSAGAVGWRGSEIDAWVDGRHAVTTDRERT